MKSRRENMTIGERWCLADAPARAHHMSCSKSTGCRCLMALFDSERTMALIFRKKRDEWSACQRSYFLVGRNVCMFAF
jgi:hypothetical protein